MEPFEFHLFAPISVLLDAFLRFTYTPTATTFGGGGYLDIVLPDNKLASFIIKAKVEFIKKMREDGGVETITHGTTQVHVNDIEQKQSHEELF